jgi:hypothetical protein
VRVRSVDRVTVQGFVVWALATVIYVVVGVFFVDFMLSVFVAMGYLLVATWLVPAAIRRWLVQ